MNWIDPKTSNLNWRKDNTRSIQENFKYDPLNRLTVVNNATTVGYDTKGNITSRAGVCTFEYTHATKLYAVTGVTPGTGILRSNQTIKYNQMMRPTSIAEGTVTTTFTNKLFLFILIVPELLLRYIEL